MHERTHGDVGEREAVAQFRGGLLTGLDHLTDLQAVRGEDVALQAVLILDEGDAGGAVRIVLDGEHGGLEFVAVADEVDDAVHSLVSAATVTHGHLTGVVTSAGGLQGLEELLVRLLRSDLLKRADRLVTLAGGYRLVLLDCHNSSSS